MKNITKKIVKKIIKKVTGIGSMEEFFERALREAYKKSKGPRYDPIEMEKFIQSFREKK
ncbi:MAG: hypothetical protein ABIM30_00610 [candidate division WOR-3 bacterium]